MQKIFYTTIEFKSEYVTAIDLKNYIMTIMWCFFITDALKASVFIFWFIK